MFDHLPVFIILLLSNIHFLSLNNRFLNELDKMPASATQIQQMPLESDQMEGISNKQDTKKGQ